MSLLSYIKRLVFSKPLEIQLVEACEAIDGLRKLGTNEELDFDYLRILDLANAIREQLLPRGIVILPSDLECIEEILETPEGRMIECRVKTEFDITDGRKHLKLSSYGSARDGHGFAIAIAQTFALKSLLKRLSMIFGEEDDPEVPRWAHRVPETTHQQKRQKEYQGRAWADAVRSSGKPAEEINAMLTEAMGLAVTSEKITSLPAEDFNIAMQLLVRNSDMTNILEMSRDQAAKKEPQKIA